MFLGERGRYFQVQKDQGAAADQPVQAEGADKSTIPVLPEADIEQLKEIAATRGEAAAVAQAVGLMNS